MTIISEMLSRTCQYSIILPLLLSAVPLEHPDMFPLLNCFFFYYICLTFVIHNNLFCRFLPAWYSVIFFFFFCESHPFSLVLSAPNRSFLFIKEGNPNKRNVHNETCLHVLCQGPQILLLPEGALSPRLARPQRDEQRRADCLQVRLHQQ